MSVPPFRNAVGASEHSAHFWLGRLSAALAVAPEHPKEAQKVLDEFIRSPVPTEELKSMLRKDTPR